MCITLHDFTVCDVMRHDIICHDVINDEKNISLRKLMLLNAKCLFCGALPKCFMIVHYSDYNNDFIVHGIGRYEGC